MQTESQEGTVGIIPPSRRRPPLVGSHYSVSALVLVIGAIPPPPPSSPRWSSRWLPFSSLFDGSGWEQQGKGEEGGEGSGGGGGGAMRKWCVVCALEYVTHLTVLRLTSIIHLIQIWMFGGAVLISTSSTN
jgi:hypothetical protein